MTKIFTFFCLLFMSLYGFSQVQDTVFQPFNSEKQYEFSWHNPPPGGNIVALKALLQKKGYDMGPDCNLGGVPYMRIAIAKFQEDNCLPPTRRLDAQTLEALGIDMAIPITENWANPALMKALLQFQRDNGLRVGYLDDETLKALGI